MAPSTSYSNCWQRGGKSIRGLGSAVGGGAVGRAATVAAYAYGEERGAAAAMVNEGQLPWGLVEIRGKMGPMVIADMGQISN